MASVPAEPWWWTRLAVTAGFTFTAQMAVSTSDSLTNRWTRRRGGQLPITAQPRVTSAKALTMWASRADPAQDPAEASSVETNTPGTRSRCPGKTPRAAKNISSDFIHQPAPFVQRRVQVQRCPCFHHRAWRNQTLHFTLVSLTFRIRLRLKS